MADYSFPCYLLTEPSAPPSNVIAHSESSTSIFVSWGQVPFSDQNGVIVSYTVSYIAFPSGSTQTKTVTAPRSQTTLTGLHEYTNYSITVFASTSKGGGNASRPIFFMTDGDGKQFPLLATWVIIFLSHFSVISLEPLVYNLAFESSVLVFLNRAKCSPF